LSEFLLANGDEKLVNFLRNVETIAPIPDAFFNPLYEKLKMYFITGSMPESVKCGLRNEIMYFRLYRINLR
jgi:hypothetical protein